MAMSPKELIKLAEKYEAWSVEFGGREYRAIAEGLRMLASPSSNQPVADSLKLLSDLFSETAHENWTKSEVVEVIEDFAKVRCPDISRPERG